MRYTIGIRSIDAKSIHRKHSKCQIYMIQMSKVAQISFAARRNDEKTDSRVELFVNTAEANKKLRISL